MGVSKLTLIGLYNYDQSILDNFELPEGIDRNVFNFNLLMQAGEFEVLYSDFDFLKTAIGIWSKSRVSIWDELLKTTQYEYNPIDNYDRHETRTITGDRQLSTGNTETRNLTSSNTETRDLELRSQETRNLTSSDTETRDLDGTNNETRNLQTTSSGTENTHTYDNEVRNLRTDYEDNGTVTDSGTNTNTRTVEGRAFNDTTLVTKESIGDSGTNGNTKTNDLDGYKTDTGTDNREVTGLNTTSNTVTETGTDNRTWTEEGTVSHSGSQGGSVSNSVDDDGTITNQGTLGGSINNSGSESEATETEETVYIHGNIGVKTTQSMIQEQREIVNFSVIDYIINEYKHNFCIMVY